MRALSRLKTRAYLTSELVLRRTHAAAKALLDGVWLGLLNQDDLYAIDELYYARHQEYVGPTHNRQGLFPWETKALQRHFTGCKRLVLTGAGGGREVIPLVKLGYELQAFECNPSLLAAAQRLAVDEGLSAHLGLVPRDEWPREATSADGVIVGWGSYMLVRGRARRLRFLAGARAALPTGGPILLSYFDRLSDTRYFRVVSRVGGALAHLRRAQGESVEMGDSLVPNFAHHFTASEIADELAAADFTLVDSGTAPYGWAVGLAR